MLNGEKTIPSAVVLVSSAANVKSFLTVPPVLCGKAYLRPVVAKNRKLLCSQFQTGKVNFNGSSENNRW